MIRTNGVASANPNGRPVVDNIATSQHDVRTDQSEHNMGEKLAETLSAPAITLPGALEHPILQLSDDKFRNTPVSEMFKWYGQAEGGGTCAEDFGYKLIGTGNNVHTFKLVFLCTLFHVLHVIISLCRAV